MASKTMEQLTQEYLNIRPLLENLEVESNYILNDMFNSNPIKIHRIESRVKELDSVMAKARNIAEANNQEASLSSCNDLLGLRIVCLFLSDMDEICKLLKQEFEILSEDNKVLSSDVQNFGYQSIHLLAKLPSGFKGPRYNKLKSLTFEIQVRTIAMDAWASISHTLSIRMT
jgi:putative GTP pyrophosphokinase